MNRMDDVIEKDVAELRSFLEGVPGPSEPHPAYWNNFLLRVHERIEEKQVPKKKAWWSPALIWGSLSGVAALLLVTYLTNLFPFGNDIPEGEMLAGNTGAKTVLTTKTIDQELDDFIISGGGADTDETAYFMLTQGEIEMLNAIEADDDDAILRAIIGEDVSLEI